MPMNAPFLSLLKTSFSFPERPERKIQIYQPSIHEKFFYFVDLPRTKMGFLSSREKLVSSNLAGREGKIKWVAQKNSQNEKFFANPNSIVLFASQVAGIPSKNEQR